RVGLMLAQGKSLSDILAELGQVAEGVRCVSVVTQLAQKLNIEMPITEAVSAIVHDGKSIQAVLQDLLARESKLES
ncbi:MAG TPA: NAD(P)H-dependent glycerol-3-phosphate dehydrogenase, partial [Limnobacter sp.]